jgi:hypothetical protein
MTKRRPTPQEKKRLRYAKDFDPAAEYPHGFRKTWPRKKARIKQSHRRAVRQDLSELIHGGQVDEVESRIQAKKTIRLTKWGARSLGKRVEQSLQKRRDTIGWNNFRQRYSRTLHRKKFIAFLESLMEGDTPESRHRKDVVQIWLQSQTGAYLVGHRRQWLDSFFRDASGWERKLLDWMEE